jgi:hypothetical protein
MDFDKNNFPRYEDLIEYDRIFGENDRKYPSIGARFYNYNFPGSGREIIFQFSRNRQAHLLFYLIKWVS